MYALPAPNPAILFPTCIQQDASQPLAETSNFVKENIIQKPNSYGKDYVSTTESYNIYNLFEYLNYFTQDAPDNNLDRYTIPASIVYYNKTYKFAKDFPKHEEKNSMNIYPNSIVYTFSISMGLNIIFLSSTIIFKLLGKSDVMCLSLFLLLLSMLVTWKSAEKALLIKERSAA